MEDVRMSNFAFSQTKIGEYITLIFAIIGIESAIIASEMNSSVRNAHRDYSAQYNSFVNANNQEMAD